MPVPNSSRVQSCVRVNCVRPGRQNRRASRFKFPTIRLLLILLFFSPALLLARAPQPSARILLDDLGFEGLSQRYLFSGSSMVTLHYVDGTHILLTFVAHRLIRRIPDDPPTDQDRNVDALLLELPSGRVLARAEWVLHDHGQYLWSLGHGQFLLRVRNTFTTIAPLAHLATGHAFVERPFLRTNRRVVLASLSADAGLLTIETADPIPLVTLDSQSTNSAPGPDQPQLTEPTNIQINFYRLAQQPNQQDSSENVVIPRSAGGAFSRHPVDLPLSPGGVLNVLDQGRQRWAFDFRTHFRQSH